MSALAPSPPISSRLALGGPQTRDPASLPYPPTFPVELALRQFPVKDICEAYGIDQQTWNTLRMDPLFVQDLRHWVQELKKEGMSFKIKARLQAEALLTKSWEMIHSPPEVVPAVVKADLLKFTIRAAGLDGSKDQAAAAASAANNLQINLIMS